MHPTTAPTLGGTTAETTTEETQPLAYALPEAARQLGLDTEALLALIERGAVAVVRLGDHLLIERAELTAMLARHRSSLATSEPFGGSAYITPREAAAYAGVSPSVITKLFRQYQFPGSMKVGARVRIKTSSFLTWCEAGGSLRRHGDPAPTAAEEYLVRGSRMRAIAREMQS